MKLVINPVEEIDGEEGQDDKEAEASNEVGLNRLKSKIKTEFEQK